MRSTVICLTPTIMLTFRVSKMMHCSSSFFYLSRLLLNFPIGPFHNAVTSYKITHAGEQVAQWPKGLPKQCSSYQSTWICLCFQSPTGQHTHQRAGFVPCDQIVQRAYFDILQILTWLWVLKNKAKEINYSFLALHVICFGWFPQALEPG